MEMFYLTTHSTHFNYGYKGIGHMVKEHSARQEIRCRQYMGYSFSLAANGAFICTIPQRAQSVHHEDRSDDQSHHEKNALPRSYISLPFVYGLYVLCYY